MMYGKLKTLYQVTEFPIFQNRMYSTTAEARACPKGDLAIVEDQTTGLVYNAAFQPSRLDYDSNYQNEQAGSPTFQRHLEHVVLIVDESLGRERLIEVGCGKGFFLELLVRKGFDVRGFDPAYEGSSSRVTKDYFSGDAGIRADGLILRHVLEHIENPVAFLEALKAANGGQGKIYIEVPSFDWICQRRAWFDIFYEHVNYFRLSDFRRIFSRIEACGSIFGDQYLYVVADLGSMRTPVYDPNDAVTFPSDFVSVPFSAHDNSSRLPVCVWGGASKGVIFSLMQERAGFPVSTVVDINPAKQGKYLPGTGLRVESPAQAMKTLPNRSTILVMNSNYLEEIKEMSNNRYRYIEIDQ